jgi:nicotinamide-nucleotide amidase
VIGSLLQAQEATVGVAESCTGGGIGQLFTDVPGSSRYFLGGITAYDNQVKVQTLGVAPQDLEREGAVSSIVAEQMAAGIRDRLGVSWGLSVTGIAGPGGGTLAKPVGLVYVGLAGPDQRAQSFEYRFGARRSRAWIRHVTAYTALDVLRRALLTRAES